MIRGIHGLLYSTKPEATRAFFRDTVRLPGCDVGEGWWIFDFPEGDLGVHPIEDPADAGVHDISSYCDDIAGTVRAMKARGVRFTAEIADHGYGLVTYFEAPGGIKVQLYEPRYVKGTTRKTALAKRAKAGSAKKRSPAAKRAKKKATGARRSKAAARRR